MQEAISCNLSDSSAILGILVVTGQLHNRELLRWPEFGSCRNLGGNQSAASLPFLGDLHGYHAITHSNCSQLWTPQRLANQMCWQEVRVDGRGICLYLKCPECLNAFTVFFSYINYQSNSRSLYKLKPQSMKMIITCFSNITWFGNETT